MKILKNKKIDIFNIINFAFFAFAMFLMVYPFWYVFMYSISDAAKAGQGGMFLLPIGFSFDNYRTVFNNSSLLSGLKTSIIVTVLGTFFGVLITAMTAYPLSKSRLKGGTVFLFIIFFTMLFNGGMIPNYLLIKQLGLLDTYGSLILPLLVNPFNLFIFKNFFAAMPNEIEESATIDGANDILIFFRLILPLSKAVLATITLFVAVVYWNDFFSTVLYISSKNKWALQAILRELMSSPSASTISQSSGVMPDVMVTSKSLRMANIIVATVPILAVYPFLQRHFAKGVMIGSIKG